MIPTNDERMERQLYAAYRLILSWPKHDARRHPDHLDTPCRDGECGDSEILKSDLGDATYES